MKRFMIIEDNKMMAQILTQLLRKCAKPQSIIHTTSPQTAVNALINNTLDCVFLDLNLEKPLDGIPVLQFIKKQFPSLPVVIVSGDSEMETVKQVILLKPADYIVKPLSIQKIERCLTKVLPTPSVF